MESNISNKVKDFSKPLTNDKISNNIIGYCWANEKFNTWFITKAKKEIVPDGSRLLMKILGESTTLNLNLKSTYPQVNDVVSFVDGKNVLINEIFWI